MYTVNKRSNGIQGISKKLVRTRSAEKLSKKNLLTQTNQNSEERARLKRISNLLHS